MYIAIIEKNKLYRESLRTILNQIEDFDVVYDSDNLFGITKLLETQKTDLILLDYNIAEATLSQISEQLEKLFPDIKIIFLSNYYELCYFDDLISKGITDIIFINAEKKEFEKKIRQALNAREVQDEQKQ